MNGGMAAAGSRPLLELATAQGPVPVWGRFGRSATRPVVFIVRGAFADPESLTRLPPDLPEADVALVHLPGMHSPFFAESSVRAFAAAFDEVVAREFAGRPLVKAGLSTGALVALAMRSPGAVAAFDPPLTTDALWPLIPGLRVSARDSELMAGWISEIFGVTAEGLENRDYRPLLEACKEPGVVVIPGEPLEPPRPLPSLPGLMTAEDRMLAQRHPTLRAMIIQGAGHNIPRDHPRIIPLAIRQALAALGSRDS
jgi:hypothetical protein